MSDTNLIQLNLLGESVPEDNVLMQTNSENKFLGSMLWKAFDFLSFGAFDKKPSDAPVPKKTIPEKIEEKKAPE